MVFVVNKMHLYGIKVNLVIIMWLKEMWCVTTVFCTYLLTVSWCLLDWMTCLYHGWVSSHDKHEYHIIIVITED